MVVDHQTQAWPGSQPIRGDWKVAFPFLGGHRAFEFPGKQRSSKGLQGYRGLGRTRALSPFSSSPIPGVWLETFLYVPYPIGQCSLGLPQVVA